MLPPELSVAIDDLMKSDLQYWRDWCFHWLLLSSAMVIIGVALEGPELLHGAISIVLRKFCRADSAERNQLPDWVALLGLLGWFLVVLGVAGEYVADALVSKAEGNLQTFNDIMLTDARRETALAFERAAQAEATARGFEAQIAESKAAAESAEVTAKKFEAQIADAQQAAAESKKESAQIEESLAGRNLTLKDSEALSQNLSGFQGQQTVWIGYRAGDAEAEVFAWDIAKALHDAKWNVNSPGATVLMAPLGKPYNPGSANGRTGIEITSTETHRVTAQALAAALRLRGFDAQANSVSHPRSEDRMDVFIWVRPRGPQGEAKLKLETAKKKQAQSSQITK